MEGVVELLLFAVDGLNDNDGTVVGSKIVGKQVGEEVRMIVNGELEVGGRDDIGEENMEGSSVGIIVGDNSSKVRRFTGGGVLVAKELEIETMLVCGINAVSFVRMNDVAFDKDLVTKELEGSNDLLILAPSYNLTQRWLVADACSEPA